mmetsp:Transcript_14376/g.48596  ORF Transcript_14376/g.48596 Transcript_14376/m.48596 type:complete len:379 (+) Transcript_14376:678-1814(+)
MSALSFATCAPAPTAMPRLAYASAGESLMPSPTMATVWPCRWSSDTRSALSFGARPARTREGSMPTSAATHSAALAWSPVSSHTSRPMARSAATAVAASPLGRSATPRTPLTLPPAARHTAVRPRASTSHRAASSRASSAMWWCFIHSRLPTSTATSCSCCCGDSGCCPAPSGRGGTGERSLPMTLAKTVEDMTQPRPRPGRTSKRSAGGATMPFSRTARSTAPAMGCSEPCSAAAARRRRRSRASSSSTEATSSAACGTGTTSVSVASPVVSVPVLSNTTTLTRWAVSKAGPPLMSTPCEAPTLVPTITASGVARPSAHGQEMTSTLMPKSMLKSSGPPFSPPVGTTSALESDSHTVNVTRERETTVGANMEATRSA